MVHEMDAAQGLARFDRGAETKERFKQPGLGGEDVVSIPRYCRTNPWNEYHWQPYRSIFTDSSRNPTWRAVPAIHKFF